MKVFKFYRDLINFRGKGSPALMLKCINPTEVWNSPSAAYLDGVMLTVCVCVCVCVHVYM